MIKFWLEFDAIMELIEKMLHLELTEILWLLIVSGWILSMII